MSDARLHFPGDAEPASAFTLEDGWPQAMNLQAGDRVIVEIGEDEVGYHYDGEQFVRAHVLVDCWCGGSR